MHPSDERFELRPPTVADGRLMWQLVQDAGVLDRNSLYCYALFCRDFADTSLVAFGDQELAGFVTAYRPPTRPDCIFVWQVGVASPYRRCGLGLRMLQQLVTMPHVRGCQSLEATVTPSNQASRKLFERFAISLQARLDTQPGFSAAELNAESSPEPGEQVHEAEMLLRISPLPQFENA